MVSRESVGGQDAPSGSLSTCSACSIRSLGAGDP